MGLKKIYDEDGNHVGQLNDGKPVGRMSNSDPGCVLAILLIFGATASCLEGHWSMWILIPLAVAMLLWQMFD